MLIGPGILAGAVRMLCWDKSLTFGGLRIDSIFLGRKIDQAHLVITSQQSSQRLRHFGYHFFAGSAEMPLCGVSEAMRFLLRSKCMNTN